MKSIWYFVGIVLMIIGTIILIKGIFDVAGVTENQTILASLCPNLWWGALMIIFGGIMFFAQRKSVIS